MLHLNKLFHIKFIKFYHILIIQFRLKSFQSIKTLKKINYFFINIKFNEKKFKIKFFFI